MYLVETDVVILYLNGRALEVNLLESLLPDGVAMSVVTFGELYEDIVFGRHPARQLASLRLLPHGVSVIDVNRRVAREYGRVRGLLRQQGQLLPAPDLLIASTALAHDLTLVTRNLRHVQRIPGLRLYQQHP